MPFREDVISGINRISRTAYDNPTDFSKQAKVSQPIISKLLSGKTNPRLDIIGRILDAAGARLVFPDETRDRDVVVAAVDELQPAACAPERLTRDCRAVPLLSIDQAASRPGRMPTDLPWLVVPSLKPAVRFRKNLVAVALDQHHDHMEPTVLPGDTVLVDLDDQVPTGDRSIFLVRDPSGSPRLCRVKAEPRRGKTLLIYYGDNTAYAPSLHILEEDFRGDITRAIVGRCLLGYCDLSRK